MKKIAILCAFALTTTGLAAQLALKNSVDSASYAYGIIIGNSIKRQMTGDVNKDVLVQAIRTVLDNGQTQFDFETANQVFSDYNKTAQAKTSEKSKMEGINFLEENKKRKEVTTTASGLQYEIIRKGSATTHPKATDKVEVHYHGTNIDGSVFDSSKDRGQTASFGLNQVIKGWTEGLQYMSPGDVFKFYIPSELAYGDRSPSPKIKAGATLVFEVELFKIL